MKTAPGSEIPLWALLIAVAIGTGLLWVFLRDFLRARRARGWPTAPGRILEAHYDADSEGYELKLAYEYQVAGVALRGTRCRFASSHYVWKHWIKGIVARYPVGTPVRVLYDPANPTLCVLEADFEWLSWIPVLLFTLVVLVPLIWLRFAPGARTVRDAFAPGELENPASVEAALRQKFALHELETITFLPTRVTVCAPDPGNPQHHDLHDFSAGSFDESRPTPHPCTPRFPPSVRIPSPGDPFVAVEPPPQISDTFRLSDVDFAVLPKIVADARRRTSVENGSITHLDLGRSVYQAVRETIVDVFISGARGSQALHYDLQGTFIDNLGQYNRAGLGPRPWARDGGTGAPHR